MFKLDVWIHVNTPCALTIATNHHPPETNTTETVSVTINPGRNPSNVVFIVPPNSANFVDQSTVSVPFAFAVADAHCRKNGGAGATVRIGDDDSHNLQEYTYKKITPCDVCSQVLRGELLAIESLLLSLCNYYDALTFPHTIPSTPTTASSQNLSHLGDGWIVGE